MPVPVDLSKLSDVVKNDVVKKIFMIKSKYNTDKTELEKKNPNVTDFV